MGSTLPAAASLLASAGILFLSLGPVVSHCNPCCFGIRSGLIMVSPQDICSCCQVDPKPSGVAGYEGLERLCCGPGFGGESSALVAAHQGVTAFGEIFPVCECEEAWASGLGPPSPQRGFDPRISHGLLDVSDRLSEASLPLASLFPRPGTRVPLGLASSTGRQCSVLLSRWLN
jgi:hypothetical protein